MKPETKAGMPTKKVKAFDPFGANAQVQQAAPARVVAPQGPPAKPPLPPGWEEQFSDEYQVAYYWHSER